MNDAPKRIWVEPKAIDLGSSDGPFYTVNGSIADIPFVGMTEYVRADLFAALLKQIDDCAMYLKPGETPRQRMDRDFGDVQALLKLLEKEKRKNEEKL